MNQVGQAIAVQVRENAIISGERAHPSANRIGAVEGEARALGDRRIDVPGCAVRREHVVTAVTRKVIQKPQCFKVERTPVGTTRWKIDLAGYRWACQIN